VTWDGIKEGSYGKQKEDEIGGVGVFLGASFKKKIK
jgi:hypothetical protein